MHPQLANTLLTLQTLKAQLDVLNDSQTQLLNQKRTKEELIQKAEQQVEVHKKARMICEATRIFILQNSHARLENVVTYAIQSVIGRVNGNLGNRFVIELLTRRNQFEIDFWNEGADEGREPLFSSCGGTYWDTASAALLVSIRSLLGMNSPLYLDEVGKFVSPDMAGHFGEFLQGIAQQLDCQIILNSHLPDMASFADRAFRCRIDNGCSKITVFAH